MSRLETIQKARSVAEVLDVVNSIKYDSHNCFAIVKRVIPSVSAEINIDRSGKSRTVKKARQDDTFHMPNMAELRKHSDVVTRLYDNVVDLDSAEALVKQAFQGNKKQPAALKAIQELRKEVDLQVRDAFESLQALAEKHLPESMDKMRDLIVSYLIKRVPAKSYSNMSKDEVYVAPDAADKNSIHMCAYIGLEKLKNNDGYVFDEYYFVLTGVISKSGEVQYFLNGLPSFKLPGKYPLGKQIDDPNSVRLRVDLLLHHNNLALQLDKLPMPIDADKAGKIGIHNIRGIEKVDVKDDELLLHFKAGTSEATVNNGIKDVMSRLTALMGMRGKHEYTYKMSTVKGAPVVRMAILPKMDKKDKPVALNLHKLDEMSELFDLTDKQKEALRFALQH